MELQKQEKKPLGNGDEGNFELALQTKLIKDSSFEEVKEVLRKIMMKIGIRANNLPTDIEKLLLYEHILRYYGGNRLEEIPLAFDMALTAKLDLDTDDIKCYENFSCAYFSTIMNAYRKWAEETYRIIKKEVPLLENKPDLEQIEKEYQEFLKSPLAEKFKPNI